MGQEIYIRHRYDTVHMFSAKERIRRIFQSSKADVLVISNGRVTDSNFLYLTGFTSGVFENTFMIVTRKGTILFASALEYDTARSQKPKEMKIVKLTSSGQLIKQFGRYLRGKRVGINESFIPYRHYRAIKRYGKPKTMVDVSESLARAREIKDKGEIAKITTANRIMKRVLREAPHYFKTGMTEKQLAAEIDYLMMKYGADGTSFPSLICFDKNSAYPHHLPNDTRLRPNSLVLLDCGSKYKNYCSDVTRTFIHAPDKKSDKYKRMVEMLAVVKEAQSLGISKVRIGAKGSAAHNAVADFLDKTRGGKYKGKFIHGLGHAIGIDVHDPGTGLFPSSDARLQENMVTSVEPGVYIVGFGGVRIEDDIVVTKKGAKVI